MCCICCTWVLHPIHFINKHTWYMTICYNVSRACFMQYELINGWMMLMFMKCKCNCGSQTPGVLQQSLTLNKSWSLSGVLHTLFLDQDLIQLLSVSYSGLKFECSADLAPLKYFTNWQLWVDMFVTFYLPNSYGSSI